MTRARTVVSVVPDLLTATRIAATARQLQIVLVTARSEEALEVCRRLRPDLILVDLEAEADPTELIRALKQDPETRPLALLGFYAHVHNSLRESALAAGADRVLPRSAFTRKLAELLAGEPDTPD